MWRSSFSSLQKQCQYAADGDQVVRYLNALFAGLHGVLDVRAFDPLREGGPPRRRAFAETLESAGGEILHAADMGLNVFIGMATRRDASNGGKANLGQVRAVWVDLDPSDAKTVSDFEARLDAFPLSPSLVVRTGGGLHAYWLLDEPLEFDELEPVARFEAVLKGLALDLGGDRAATDASRVLRVPGTWNHPGERKRARGRKTSQATIEELTPARVYAFDRFAEFEEHGAALVTPSAKALYETQDWGGELPTAVACLMAEDRAVWRLLHAPAGRPHEFDESRTDFDLARRLAWRGLPGVVIEHAVRWRRARFGTDKRKGSGYFTRTTGKALAAIEVEREGLRRKAFPKRERRD